MYDTVEEAKQKLANCVVLYDGHPMYVRDAGKGRQGIELYCYKLPVSRVNRNEDFTLLINDPKWDFKTFGSKLGYMSIKNPANEMFESLFVSRVPVRHSRQGLDDKTTLLTPCLDEGSYRFSFHDVIYNDTFGIIKTIKNDFPSPESAFKLLTENPQYHSVPIHRKITFLYDQVSPPYLVYRNDKIGYSEDGKTFKLAKHKTYLQEELSDMIGLKIA